MARTHRFQFHLGPFRAAFLALPLIACASASAKAAEQGGRLFLLTGTCCLNDTSATFPARLYTVSAQHKLKLFRTVVSGSEGTTNILDDMRGEIYVTFPSNLGVSRAPTKVSIIHKQRPGEDDVVTFNPHVMLDEPYAGATAAGPDHSRYVLFVLFPEPPPTVNSHATFMRYLHSSATTLVAVAGNPPATGPRITRNDWALYRHLTFAGSPGGPGAYPTPEATVENGHLVMRYGGKTIFVDHAPAFPKDSPRTIWILAASSRFVVSVPLHFAGGNYTVPATMYVHDRRSETWKQLKSAGSMPQCRVFGPWLATRIRNFLERGGGPIEDKNPGHLDESDHWVLNLLPNVKSEYDALDSQFYIPGVFILDSLADGRRIRLDTHEEDSEILDVRKDGLVLYRVNNEIFSARIEGDKLSAPKLVVKGEDVPEVHWVFWSRAGTEPHSTAHNSAKR
jgi:hypothetical protein